MRELTYIKLSYFNPRPREGDDVDHINPVANGGISIHVPARGTTDNGQRAGFARVISIHVPARGTTFIEKHIIRGVTFQSTSPRGGRRLKNWGKN